MRGFPILIIFLIVFFILLGVKYDQNSKTSGVFVVSSCVYDIKKNEYNTLLIDTLTGSKLTLVGDSALKIGSIMDFTLNGDTL